MKQGELESNGNGSEAPESEPRVADAPPPSSDNVDMKIIGQLPQINVIGKEPSPSFKFWVIVLSLYMMCTS